VVDVGWVGAVEVDPHAVNPIAAVSATTAINARLHLRNPPGIKIVIRKQAGISDPNRTRPVSLDRGRPVPTDEVCAETVMVTFC
jgi:hypothetical protein